MPKAKAKAKPVATKPKTTKKSAAKKRSRFPLLIAPADDQPFLTFQITQQSMYWIIFGIAAIAFAAWIYMLDSKIQALYDQVDANTYSITDDVYLKPATKKATEAITEAQ